MARITLISITDKPSHNRERRPAHHHDDNKQIPGWAPERQPKDEPYIANKNLSLGRWIERASKNSYASNPSVAPGCGTRKSS
jgi:hypothetical protein